MLWPVSLICPSCKRGRIPSALNAQGSVYSVGAHLGLCPCFGSYTAALNIFVAVPGVLKCPHASTPGELVKAEVARPHSPPGNSHSANLGWGPRLCVSNEFPGSARAAGLRATHTLRASALKKSL